MNPQELVNDIKDIKAMITDLKKREELATAEQLKAITNRPITLDPKALADHVKDDLKEVLPDKEKIKDLFADLVEQMRRETNDCVDRINKSVERVPRKISVAGDIYGFTTLKAALIYGGTLIALFFGCWLVCNHYRDQAQETVIYQQAQEVIREKNFYYNQIQTYKRNNPRYSKLFPEY